ncbi:hemolysin-type calcium-binding repeat 2 copies family protein [Asticcacaulis biprosthecium C19]|uniref:Hemolysin-type calcium-binding repeat 2 copies family protein n=1 Tax=Asticcacaulis biprosthecium C19 TaxID=715226 RepID=F4QTQ1_9CAUL|nr:FG-GAP repeat protein [Asticcacaulis biprosthecium]EGF89201.1 hemolysin-type calcium-binding repeat 2 copies family protein [Asticcacaulis biprosthecium C19]
MPLPVTKLYLSTLLTEADGAYELLADEPGSVALTPLTFPSARWVSGLNDINGDGVADLIVGGAGDDDKDIDAGRIYVRFGLATGGTSDVLPDAINGMIIDGVNAGDMAGAAVGSVADMNGDGRGEILIGAPLMEKGAVVDAGAGFVIWGLPGGGVDLGDPFSGGGDGWVMKGEAAGDHAGLAMAAIADLNGDGRSEILIAAPGNDAGGADAGSAYVVWGKTSASAVQLVNVAAGTGGFKIVGESAGDEAGITLTSLADLNGDGKAEVVVGATGNDGGGTDAGAVYVVWGKSTTTQVNLDLVAAGTGGYKITGLAGEGAGAGIAAIGDVNGDGLSDLLITTQAGDKAYVVFGKATGDAVFLSDVEAGIGGFAIVAEQAGDLAGASVSGGTDFNQDGVADLVIGTPHNSEGGYDAGAVYLVWGGAGEVVDLSLVAQGAGGAKIVGTYGSLTGAAVAVNGDMNRDGRADLVVGAPGSTESVSVVYANDLWQPDLNIYGTQSDDLMTAGYGGTRKIDDTANSIYAFDGNDTLAAGGGNDLVDGGQGADEMAGNAGDDTYYVDDAGDATIEVAGEGLDEVVASVDWTLAANLENLTLKGWGLAGTGNSLANTLTGTDGGDALNGMAGGDTMVGGAGNDSYSVDTVNDVVTEVAGGGTDTVYASRSWVLGADLENLVLTGAARAGTGNSLANILTGTAFADTLDGGAGSDQLIGGLGDDSYKVDTIADVVIEMSGEGLDVVTTTVDYTLGANIEVLRLSGAARRGTGNALANSLFGTTSSDVLDGGGGADSLTGGKGNDSYLVDNAADVVIESALEGTDTVTTAVDGYVLSDQVERLVLAGAARHATGNGLDNLITGTTGHDVLDGGLGADSLSGGAGNDTYYVDSVADRTTELLAGGSDMVVASVDWTLGSNVENLTLVGGARVGRGNALDNVLVGTVANDSLYGGDGNDLLDGGAGGDRLSGGLGDDTYLIDSSTDVVVESAGAGYDTVIATFDYVLQANVEVARLLGSGHTLTGNTGNNILEGGSGDDVLNGGGGDDLELGGDGHDDLVSTSGHDTLSGGSGDDVYLVDGGWAEIEDFLGHDTIDCHDGTEDNYIDLSGETESEIENEVCELGQGGTVSGPLDVQFLQDLTGSFGDDIANVRALVPAIVTALRAVQADSRFGVSDFVDKPISPFGAPGEWVYRLAQALTSDVAAFESTYNSLSIRNGVDAPEAQIESLMHLALTSAEAGFRTESARFVILFTDAPFHVAGDGAAAGITTPNDGDAIIDGNGLGEDYPFVAQLKAALEAANIIPIFAVTADVTGVYANLVTELGRGTTVTLTSNSSNVVAAITGGLTEATRTVIEDAVGGSGDDVLLGNSAANGLTGGNGNDDLSGRAGDDQLLGGSGNDSISGDAGDDLMDGGTGYDTADYAAASGAVTVNLSLSGAAQVTGGAGTDTLVSVENVTGSAFADNLTGSTSANQIDGGDGNDTIDAGGSSDVVNGQLGDDSLLAGTGADTLDGGEGNDTLDGGSGNDTMAGGTGDDALTGGSGGDVLIGDAGNDALDGGTGTDTVDYGLATAGVSVSLSMPGLAQVTGGAGTDTLVSIENLTGSEFDDFLIGSSGSNILMGGGGHDQIVGRGGNDGLTGGAGADDFVFGLASGADRVMDFNAGDGDQLDLSAYHAQATAVIYQSGADTVIDLGGGNSVTVISMLATDPGLLSHIVW